MVQNKKLNLTKVSLVVFAVITLVYGTGYLFFPQLLVKLNGGEAVASGWLRWSGGVLLSLGIGAVLAFRSPEKQDVLMLTFALGTLLAGLALLYSLLFEPTGCTWFTLVPVIVVLVSSALLWWAKYQGKNIPKGGKT